MLCFVFVGMFKFVFYEELALEVSCMKIESDTVLSLQAPGGFLLGDIFILG